eukprot:5105425-Karenia_brevis.AAC.1
MTYCQLWSHENNPDACPAGRANDGTEGKFKDLNSQSQADTPAEISEMGHSLMISFPGVGAPPK